MKALKRVAGVFFSIVLWAVILVAALFAFTTLATRDSNQVASLAGFTPLNVVSEGDIVTFHTIINNEYTLNTHRIEEIITDNAVRSYVTKGDNNDIADVHMISDGDIIGRYVGRLPGFGKVMDFLSSSTGFLLLIVLPLLVFFIYKVYHLITIGIDLKKAIAQEAAEEQPEAEALLEEAARAKAEAEAARAEAEAALAEAKRLQAEAAEAKAGLKGDTNE